MKTDHELLSKEIRFRISEKEKQRLDEKARLLGLNTGAYCRMEIIKLSSHD